MRSRVRGVVASCLLALLGAGLWYELRERTLPAAAAAIGARLELAAGPVRVQRAGAAIATVSGMPVPSDAQVTTGKGARALLRLLGGAAAFLGSDTALALRGSGVVLTRGRVWLDVPALAEPVMHDFGPVQVSVTNAGLSVVREAERVEIYVARGLAMVSSRKARREVASGERAIVEADGKLTIEPVSFWSDWTGGMADRGMHATLGNAGSGTIYAVDPQAQAGAAARPLAVRRQSVRARIADGVAETEVDQTFWNAGDHDVEGYYWFTIPAPAIVTGFALETGGVLVEGEVVERKQAAAKYAEAMAQRSDPALLEWIDDRTYRARIFPIPALGTRRVVLRYVEPVALGEGRVRWVYPMAGAGGGDADAAPIDELSLSVDLGELGKQSSISTLPDARIEDGGSRVTVRRSMYVPRADFQIELAPKLPVKPLRFTRFAAGADQADFVMLRWVPDVPWNEAATRTSDLVVAVDVSAGGDDADRALETSAAEAILQNLAAGDHFALVTTDIVPRVIYPDQGLASADPAHVAAALERLASVKSGGATDLGAMFDPGLSRLHAAEQPAFVYVGDGRATSGELSGSELVEHLRRSLEGSRARFFSLGVGDGANHALLERLAAVGGGSHFRIDDAALAVPAALQLTAAVKTPTITDLVLELGAGLDEPLSNVAGKLARGQELLLLARTHHDLPAHVKIRGRLDGKAFERSYPLEAKQDAATALVPRLWAAELVRRQIGRASSAEDARAKVVALALEYGLVTPFSSVLALDDEAAYQRMGISRRPRPWDRLSRASARLEPSSPLGTALAVATAPLSMLVGCNSAPDARALSTIEEEAPQPAAAPNNARTAEPSPAPAKQLGAGAREAVPASPQDAPRAAGDALAPRLADTELAAEEKDDARAELAGALGFARELEAGALGTAYGASSAHAAASARLARREPLSLRSQPGPSTGSHRRASRYALAGTCSDAASRPLAPRVLLWQRRLRSAQTMSDALALHDAARAACEVPLQHDQRVLMSLLVSFADNAEAADQMFAHFAHDPRAVTFLARQLLRRAFDPYVEAVARRYAQGGRLDWARLDLELAALPSDEARIARLRQVLLGAEHDLDAELRLMKFLVRAGKRDEALPMASRLRERGLFSPSLLRELGDIQLAAGLRDDALRTYTEILEFDPASAQARALVGDLLLAHGWYDVAYRQFRTLVELTPGSAPAQMRLGLAAAGSGRTDEALRILRAVAQTDVEPGADDPRLHARLLASAIIARLLAQPSQDAARVEALTRQLKQLQVLTAPGKLCLLTWDALSDSLGFGEVSGDRVDAVDVGLVALGASTQSLEALRAQVALRSQHGSGLPVGFKLHEISFDGTSFHVKVLDGELG